MPRLKCSECGREEWREKLHFCATDEIYLCDRCCVFAGLADPQPRCPMCFRLVNGDSGSGVLFNGDSFSGEIEHSREGR